MFVIGTAGHVDHGKSTLVRALSGINPDRLREEQEREMTIDLGFAWLTLPSGREISIVDVPGHEDFIKNMLAGIGGIDMALLVIAADEGIMPQTEEHLQILDLLDVSHGVVALTKTDMVEDPEWLELVQEEVRERLESTSLCDAPIVPVSAQTRTGLDQLVAQIEKVLDEVQEPADMGRPRLPIDRVFTISGFGTVVTGTLAGGQLHVGDEMVIVPGGNTARIRGLQTHQEKLDVASPGNRVAVNLSGVSADDLRRGQVIAKANMLAETRLIDAKLRVVDGSPWPITHNMAVEVFTGAERVQANVRLLDQEELAPGYEGWVQFRLSDTIAAAKRDRYVMRLASPSVTLGGGVFVDVRPTRRHRRFRPDVIERLRALGDDDPAVMLRALIAGHTTVSVQQTTNESQTAPEVAWPLIDELVSTGLVIALDETGREPHLPVRGATVLMAAQTWQQLLDSAQGILTMFHKTNPLRLGMSREELKSRLGVDPHFDAVLATAVSRGYLVDRGAHVSLAEHTVVLSDAQQKAADALVARFTSLESMPTPLEAQEAVGPELLQYLVDTGQLVRVSDDVIYRQEQLAEMQTKLVSFLADQGQVTVAQVRDLLGTSRKFALAFLEEMDRQRVTRRLGDVRVRR